MRHYPLSSRHEKTEFPSFKLYNCYIISINSQEPNKQVVAGVSGSWVGDVILCVVQPCYTGLARFMRPCSIVIQTVKVEISIADT